MKLFLALFFLTASACADERAIQRALIQRDQQSAEFARRGLETLHSNQLRDAGRQPPGYERQRMARERELVKPTGEKKAAVPDYKPLPLPGSDSPPSVVMPISTPSIGG